MTEKFGPPRKIRLGTGESVTFAKSEWQVLINRFEDEAFAKRIDAAISTPPTYVYDLPAEDEPRLRDELGAIDHLPDEGMKLLARLRERNPDY